MQWTRSIVVERPLAQVQEAIADEHRLMEWSAWPEATGYHCAVDGDGRLDRLRHRVPRLHRRRARAAAPDEGGARPGRVPPAQRRPRRAGHDPEVDFRLERVDETRTYVHLDFRAAAPLPVGVRQVVELLLGRRVRRLHDEDLERLKVHVEQAPDGMG